MVLVVNASSPQCESCNLRLCLLSGNDMDFFTKPLAEITTNDISWLVSNKLRETYNLEFKALPTSQDDKVWIKPDRSSTDEGKKKILKEIVAFANAGGGTLIFGISEEDACAKNITPISDAEDCAGRFKDICRSVIEPAIPSLEVRAILTDGRAGVLVFRVAQRSPMALFVAMKVQIE